jgi:hypothetical protein
MVIDEPNFTAFQVPPCADETLVLKNFLQLLHQIAKLFWGATALRVGLEFSHSAGIDSKRLLHFFMSTRHGVLRKRKRISLDTIATVSNHALNERGEAVRMCLTLVEVIEAT